MTHLRNWIWLGALLCGEIAWGGDPARQLDLSAVKLRLWCATPGYTDAPVTLGDRLYFSSLGIWRSSQSVVSERVSSVQGQGACARGDGTLLVCDAQSNLLLNVLPNGKLLVLADRCAGEPLRGLNDVTVDARGNVYWSDPPKGTAAPRSGRVLRLNSRGEVTPILTNLEYPNGVEVDPQGKWLVVIDSHSNQVLRYSIPPEGEPFGKPQPLFDVGGAGGDGCAFDMQGNLWIADFHRKDVGHGRIIVINPDGALIGQIPVPARVVTNLTFGGKQGEELFCTTAEPPGVYSADVGVVGFAGHSARDLKVLREMVVPSPSDSGVIQRKTGYRPQRRILLRRPLFPNHRAP